MGSIDWQQTTALVTGGAGFLGKHVVTGLERRGCKRVVVPRSRECDLRRPEAVRCLLSDVKPDIVLHLAAVVGGIGANQSSPGSFFYDNMSMGLHLIEESRRTGISKFVGIGTICSYPKFTAVPFREDDLWNGYPEETNAPYGLAKKMLLVQLQGYRQQYGFNGIFLMPVNLYGPGDNFDLETSHVIPAMIRKFLKAKSNGDEQVTMWGDGSPTREFLYVQDAAEGILLGAERYEGSDPVNLGSGEEVSVRDLAEQIRSLTGYTGEIVWDPSRPNGQPRRCTDVTRAADLFGFRSTTSLEDGLMKTLDWSHSTVVEAERKLA